MMPRSIRWLGALVISGALAAGIVYAHPDKTEPISGEAASHLQRLRAEQVERLNTLTAVAVDDPAKWSFLWENQASLILDGDVPGFDTALGNSLIHAWFTAVGRQFHEPGDYLPLFILRHDGSEARIAIYKPNGSIQVIRMIPHRTVNAEDGGHISWEVTASEIP